MIQLDVNRYGEIAEPLKKVTVNNLFARSVVERKVKGKIFVNKIENPDIFYVIHPYGMSLLFGEPGDDIFKEWFIDYALNSSGKREREEWLQTYPGEWDSYIKNLFGDKLIHSDFSEGIDLKEKIELNGRAHFKFDRSSFPGLKNFKKLKGLKLERSRFDVYRKMAGSVVPSSFWDSADDFYEMGVGFSLVDDDQYISTAFSSFIHDNILELGIETTEQFRGRGLAKYPCAALIEYCIENGFEPVWSCRFENRSSYYLAQTLGFVPQKVTPYYRLSR